MDYNSRAAKGQALNLAVADALKNNEEKNTDYILKKYLFYSILSETVQTLSIEQIKKELHL